jgi:hypothetical protein
MELPKDLSWEITTNENGVEMITMPRFKMNEIVEYLKYAEVELKKLRVTDVSLSDGCLTCELNKKEKTYWCATNCIKGSMFKPSVH